MSSPRTHIVFQVKSPGQPVRLIVFDTQDLSIGRAAENDLSIEHVEMSRRHAIISRADGGCIVQDMGTSNGTFVNGQSIDSVKLSDGDVVRVAEVELVYRETTRNPAQLGARAEYASQLKGFGAPGAQGDGESTILGLVDTVSGAESAADDDDDDFEVRPAGDFAYDLHGMAKAAGGARNLDAELEDLSPDGLDDLDLESVAPPAQAPAARGNASTTVGNTQVWDLEEAGSGRLQLHLEIEGLTPDLRALLQKLGGKVIGLPALRIRIKDDDLG
jgi:predicted component of type VI protein secretion system